MRCHSLYMSPLPPWICAVFAYKPRAQINAHSLTHADSCALEEQLKHYPKTRERHLQTQPAAHQLSSDFTSVVAMPRSYSWFTIIRRPRFIFGCFSLLMCPFSDDKATNASQSCCEPLTLVQWDISDMPLLNHCVIEVVSSQLVDRPSISDCKSASSIKSLGWICKWMPLKLSFFN